MCGMEKEEKNGLREEKMKTSNLNFHHYCFYYSFSLYYSTCPVSNDFSSVLFSPATFTSVLSTLSSFYSFPGYMHIMTMMIIICLKIWVHGFRPPHSAIHFLWATRLSWLNLFLPPNIVIIRSSYNSLFFSGFFDWIRDFFLVQKTFVRFATQWLLYAAYIFNTQNCKVLFLSVYKPNGLVGNPRWRCWQELTSCC